MSYFLSVYFWGLSLYGVVGSSVGYCILLCFNSLCCICVIYSVGHFSWYGVLLYIVYVGGVYVLLIFVSVHSPNETYNPISSFGQVGVYYFISWEVVNGLVGAGSCTQEYSSSLCTTYTWPSYLVFCLGLLIGFFLVSTVSVSGDGFYR
uniref:NADH dehydrogenase subunit 6 n=1 Tax=Ancyrocephalus mogurndae TaxID=307077 RepID=A0A6M3R5J4_9PLAT|nr:NADH dehydrogenase subunit 6 [Ancyrocephalus mogurndae]